MKQQQRIDELEKRIDAIERRVFPPAPKNPQTARISINPNPEPQPLQPLTDEEKQFLSKRGMDPEQRAFEMHLHDKELTGKDRQLLYSIKKKRSVYLTTYV